MTIGSSINLTEAYQQIKDFGAISGDESIVLAKTETGEGRLLESRRIEVVKGLQQNPVDTTEVRRELYDSLKATSGDTAYLAKIRSELGIGEDGNVKEGEGAKPLAARVVQKVIKESLELQLDTQIKASLSVKNRFSPAVMDLLRETLKKQAAHPIVADFFRKPGSLDGLARLCKLAVAYSEQKGGSSRPRAYLMGFSATVRESVQLVATTDKDEFDEADLVQYAKGQQDYREEADLRPPNEGAAETEPKTEQQNEIKQEQPAPKTNVHSSRKVDLASKLAEQAQEDRKSLLELGWLAYGSREGVKGGKGFIGAIIDDDGKLRPFKYGTRFGSDIELFGHDQKRDDCALALKERLLEIAERKFKGDATAMGKIQECLGYDSANFIFSRQELSREDMVTIINQIDVDIMKQVDLEYKEEKPANLGSSGKQVGFATVYRQMLFDIKVGEDGKKFLQNLGRLAYGHRALEHEKGGKGAIGMTKEGTLFKYKQFPKGKDEEEEASTRLLRKKLWGLAQPLAKDDFDLRSSLCKLLDVEENDDEENDGADYNPMARLTRKKLVEVIELLRPGTMAEVGAMSDKEKV